MVTTFGTLKKYSLQANNTQSWSNLPNIWFEMVFQRQDSPMATTPQRYFLQAVSLDFYSVVSSIKQIKYFQMKSTHKNLIIPTNNYQLNLINLSNYLYLSISIFEC